MNERGKKKEKKKRKKEVAGRRYLRKIPRDPEEFITGTWLGAGVSPCRGDILPEMDASESDATADPFSR